MADAKTEAETLLIALLPFAEQMLVEHGEFFPFAAGMDTDGKVVAASGYDGDEHPSSDEVITILTGELRAIAAIETTVATALIYNVRVTPPGDTHEGDAIAAELEHRNGYAMTIIFPYHLMSDGELNLSPPFAGSRRREIFTRTMVN